MRYDEAARRRPHMGRFDAEKAVKVPTFAVDAAGLALKGASAMVYGVVYGHTLGQGGCCYGSCGYIAERVGAGEKTVSRSLSQLQGMGAITLLRSRYESPHHTNVWVADEARYLHAISCFEDKWGREWDVANASPGGPLPALRPEAACWTVDIPAFATSRHGLALSGAEAFVYGLIHGHTSGVKGCMWAKCSYVCARCGISSENTARAAVRQLAGRGLVRRVDPEVAGGRPGWASSPEAAEEAKRSFHAYWDRVWTEYETGAPVVENLATSPGSTCSEAVTDKTEAHRTKLSATGQECGGVGTFLSGRAACGTSKMSANKHHELEIELGGLTPRQRRLALQLATSEDLMEAYARENPGSDLARLRLAAKSGDRDADAVAFSCLTRVWHEAEDAYLRARLAEEGRG